MTTDSTQLDSVISDCFLQQPSLHTTLAPTTMQRLHQEEQWEALGQCILQRTLLLVLLLDRTACHPDLPANLPLLFRPASGIKGSAQFLQQFQRLWLDGEGETRRLAALGYRLSYTQTPGEEFDFTLTSLQVDLRDGLRLCRLAEVLVGARGVVAGARLPAPRRPLQVLNIARALGVLQGAGMAVEGVHTARGVDAIRPDDVADGDPDITVALVWRIAQHFQLPALVDTTTLRQEIQRLCPPNAPAPVLSGALQRGQGGGAMAIHLPLLCEWIEAVCRRYGLQLTDLRRGFADGRALCYMVGGCLLFFGVFFPGLHNIFKVLCIPCWNGG